MVQTLAFRFVAVALVLALSLVTSYSIKRYQIVLQQADAERINRAGQQRMLSQRIMLDVMRLEQGQNRYQQLEASINRFQSNHNYLTQQQAESGESFELSPEVIALYFDQSPSLDERVKNYISFAQKWLDQRLLSSDLSAMPKIPAEQVDRLLVDLDHIVNVLEWESSEKLNGLLQWTFYLLLVSIGLIALLGLVVVRPMIAKIKSNFEYLEKEKRRAEQAMLHLRHNLDARAHFLSTISHEVRTPLNGIQGMLTLVMGSIEQPKLESQINMALKCNEELLSIFERILKLSQLESDDYELTLQSINVCQYLEGLTHKWIKRAQEKGLEFHWHCETQGDWRLDPSALSFCIERLIDNAIKYTRQGRVGLNIAESEKHLIISVTDTGVGIEQSELDHVFDAFYESKQVTSNAYSNGLGISLSIVKQIIVAMNGAISVQSEVGKGSVFTIKVPSL